MDDLAGTYFVQDRSNQEELKRLIVQERMATDAMGGVLPEQEDPNRFHRILDIACGPGGWIIEVAQTYPQIKKLYGIDISPTMIHHAQKRAEVQQLSQRVEFLVMDALMVLEFPENFFDLVNLRLGVSFMRQWDWPKMFSELHRITKPQGVVRLVETDITYESESAALTTFWAAMRRGFYLAAYLFDEKPTGLVDHLSGLLLRHGFQDIQLHKIPAEFRGGTDAGKALLNNHIHGFHTCRPFLQRYGCLPPNYEALCQQITQDMQQPDFVARVAWYTFCATNPSQTQVGLARREMPS